MNHPLHNSLHDQPAMLALLAQWCQHDWLRPVDLGLAQFLAELDPHAPALLLLAAALVSHQLGQGHVCLDFTSTLANPDFALALPPDGLQPGSNELRPSQLLAGIELKAWLTALRQSPLVGEPGDGPSPLVLSAESLYLRRYWHYESRVAAHLSQRLATALCAPDALRSQLSALFSATDSGFDWQKMACAVAAAGRFSLITGGPGTGKTTTVIKLLAILQHAALQRGAPLRLCLAAPTGKAAARLTASIGAQVKDLAVADAVRARIPHQVTTLHRLLGPIPNSRRFRHHAGHPLALDVLVIDEASMIDLEMMAHLLDALPASAKLILLGDKDQLASVEAGAVLGDLCRDAEFGGYTAGTAQWLAQQGLAGLADAFVSPSPATSALAQHTVMLRHSRRFGSDSGIGQLARAVNAGDPTAAEAILQQASSDLTRLRCDGSEDAQFERLLLEGPVPGAGLGYAAYLQRLQHRPPPDASPEQWQAWAAAVLNSFEQCRLLTAVRKGRWGVEQLNQRITQRLQQQQWLEPGGPWFEGRPVMVTRNDYSLGLMNGDVGIALRLPSLTGAPSRDPEAPRLRVVFPRYDGSKSLREVLPSRLDEVETVFAMTVHKSQGSEFSHTALILPEVLSPVLTRELIYTGITRARMHFSLIETRHGVLAPAIRRRVLRRSGLRERIDASATAGTPVLNPAQT